MILSSYSVVPAKALAGLGDETIDFSTGIPTASTSGSGGGWSAWIQNIGTNLANVFSSRYSVPQVSPGTVITTPTGTMTVQTPGYPVSTPAVTPVGTASSSTVILLGALGLGFVYLLSRR